MRIRKLVALLVMGATTVAAQQDPQVAVVGGGLAGLTAAYRLEQAGIVPELFEARDRLGGRVLTYRDGSSHEELGGKFLQNGSPPIHLPALMQELATREISWEVPFSRVIRDRDQVVDALQLFKGARPPSDALYATLISHVQQSDNMAQVLQRFFAGRPDLHWLFSLFLTCYEGSPPELLGTYASEIMWRFYTLFYEAAEPGDREPLPHVFQTVKGGCDQLVKALGERLVGPVHLSCPVRALHQLSDGKIGLELEGGEVRPFDKVILTIPCSVLRELPIDAGLIPSDQLEAIATLQYGTAAKVLIKVSGEGDRGTIGYGEDFVLFFNDDGTLMTLYCSGETGKFNPHDPISFQPQLQAWMREIKTLYPGLRLEKVVAATSWANEPYSKGSYSNFGVEQWDQFNETTTAFGEEVKRVFRPVADRLFFAGEHAAFDHYAMMEGAVESGERMARMVVTSLREPAAKS
jgi:monoamine oxidase